MEPNSLEQKQKLLRNGSDANDRNNSNAGSDKNIINIVSDKESLVDLKFSDKKGKICLINYFDPESGECKNIIVKKYKC